MSDDELKKKNAELLSRRQSESGNTGIESEVGFTLSRLNVIPNDEADRRLKSEQAIDVEALLDAAKIPERHRERIVSCTTKYAAWNEKRSSIENRLGTGVLIALIGIYGNGKTQIGVELIRANARRGIRSLFCTAEDFLADVKATFQQGERRSERDVIQGYRKPRLLVIDEVGANTAKEWEMRPLFQLLNHRYNDKKDTVLISNCEAKELFEVLGPKIKSRMSEGGAIYNCGWPTFR